MKFKSPKLRAALLIGQNHAFPFKMTYTGSTLCIILYLDLHDDIITLQYFKKNN